MYLKITILPDRQRTELLTSWSRVLLEKLTESQLVKKFPAFYGTRRFVTAFTSARHLSISWAILIQSMPHSHFLKVHFNIIPQSTSGSPKLSFLQVSPPKPCMHLSPQGATCPAHHILLYLITQIIFGEELLIMRCSPPPCYVVHLSPKYSPQHPILKHPQPTFLPLCLWYGQHRHPQYTDQLAVAGYWIGRCVMREWLETLCGQHA